MKTPTNTSAMAYMLRLTALYDGSGDALSDFISYSFSAEIVVVLCRCQQQKTWLQWHNLHKAQKEDDPDTPDCALIELDTRDVNQWGYRVDEVRNNIRCRS